MRYFELRFIHIVVETSSDIGKCGFGGRSDTENGYRTAKGGINKDRLNPMYSPHHHLHYNAFYAARNATVQFLIDKGNQHLYNNWNELSLILSMN